MNESTRVMPAGGAPDADRTMVAVAVAPVPPPIAGATQMGVTVACPVCTTPNSGLETYCSECGFLLASTPGVADPSVVAAMPELIETSTGRRFPLKSGVNTVGRENSDILLVDNTVSRRHAQIAVEVGQIVVTDFASTNGTHVDGSQIAANQPATVRDGSALRFGNSALTVVGSAPVAPVTPAAFLPSAPDPPASSTKIETKVAGVLPPADAPAAAVPAPPPPPATSTPAAAPSAVAAEPPQAHLKPTGQAGVEIVIGSGKITVGRRSSNNVVITGDPYISGLHAEILCDATGCYLTDMGSTNGTIVNGEKIDPGAKQLLLDGDEIGLGQATYRFETLEAPESDEPARPLKH